jgi:hypothetical protein
MTGKSGIEGMMIHMDNCKVHNPARTTQRLERFHVIRLAHPPYSHDISLCDFWFVGWSKDLMKGHQFQSADDVRAFLVDLWSNLDQSTLISVYEGWIARLEEVIATSGDYYPNRVFKSGCIQQRELEGGVTTFRHPSIPRYLVPHPPPRGIMID